MDGAWVSVTPFFIAFTIVLFPIALTQNSWMEYYRNIRNKRRRSYKDRKVSKTNTTRQMILGGLDAYWWMPIVVFFVTVGLAILGYVLFMHEGYDWEHVDSDFEVPLIFIGFWFVILLMAWWVSDFIKPTIDKSGASWLGVLGAWFFHLAIWISMVLRHWSGWFQLPLFIAITLVFIFTSISFINSNDRYVWITKKKKECDATAVAFGPNCDE